MSDERSESGQRTTDAEGSENGSAPRDHRAGPLEIVATTISALLIMAIVGVLVWDAIHPHTPASFVTHPGQVSLSGDAYRVPVTVRNSGDEAAKSVIVHLELMSSDSVLAESDLTIDWLPGNSRRNLVGLFMRPASAPTPTGVHAEVRGYTLP